MENVIAQIQTLEQTLQEEQRRNHRGLYIIASGYVLLLLWALWDATQVYQQIQALTHPDKIAAIVAAQVRQQLPQAQRDIGEHLRQAAPQIADRLVQAALAAIPAVEDVVKRQLSEAADRLGEAMQQRAVPQLTEFLKANLKQTVAAAHYASDEALSRALVQETLKALDGELARQFNDTLFAGLAKVKSDLERIAYQPEASMNARERAEKAALLSALRMAELSRGEGSTSLLAQGLRALLSAIMPPSMFQALDRPVAPAEEGERS